MFSLNYSDCSSSLIFMLWHIYGDQLFSPSISFVQVKQIKLLQSSLKTGFSVSSRILQPSLNLFLFFCAYFEDE